MKKYTEIYCLKNFIEVCTYSLVGNRQQDPLGEDIYLGLDADLYSIGDAVIKALDKSRDLSIPEDDRLLYVDMVEKGEIEAADKWFDDKFHEWKLFDRALVEERGEKWMAYLAENYKIKTANALYKNMQIVDCELVDGVMSFFPNLHKVLRGWERCPKELQIHIPSSSPVEVVGAAAKYAIGNCRGKGADLIREILFPEGQPETFEDYLKELGLSV